MSRYAASAVFFFAVGFPGPVAQLAAQQSSARISLDVVVEDPSGNPVLDLAAGDFEILEDGRPRPISDFAFVGGGVTSLAKPSPLLVPGDPLRSIAIVIDDLGIGETAMPQLRTALGAIDREMRPGDAVAIVNTSGRPAALPKVSTSKAAIRAAAADIALDPGHRPGPLDAGFCAHADKAPSILRTLSVLRRAVDGLRELPGRKSIVFVSEGFASGTAGVAATWKDLLLYADRSAVAISTLDPRAVVPTSLSGMDCGQLRADELSASRRALAELAASTAGISLADQNDQTAFSRLMREGSGYYLLGYQTPPRTPSPARYHSVSVRIRRPGAGAVVHFHSSLFESRAADTSARTAAALDSPFALPGVHTTVSSRFWDDTGSATNSGPILQSEIWIDARDLYFSAGSDGGNRIVIELTAVTLDDSSRLLDTFKRTFTVDIPPAFRQTILGEGLTQRLALPIKKPGAYQVKVAVRDLGSDRIGSESAFTSIPDLASGGLALSGIQIGKTGEPGAAAVASPQRFHPGQTVTVGYQILNARPGADGKLSVELTTALIRGSNVLATGSPVIVDETGQRDPRRLLRVRMFQFGEDLEPGIYSLKITAVDRNATGANGTASQSVDFEIN
jgi:VWFA-related protein